MKNKILRSSIILSTLMLFVALGLSSNAQEPRTRPQEPAQEVRLPELAVQEVDSEMLRVGVPQACARLRTDVQIHDIADNFAPAGNAVGLSPALAAFLIGKPVKGYDDKRVDKIFADSFALRSCRVCYATLEFRVRHQPGLFNTSFANYSNDTILAGAAPFGPGFRFIGPTGIWGADVPNPKTVTLGITAGALTNLNSYLSTGSIPPSLDVVSQDDTEFDYTKLTVWYY